MKIKQINDMAVLPLVAAALAVSALNSQCANPVYPAVVKGDGALAYYRFMIHHEKQHQCAVTFTTAG